ncbi:MAG: D-glycero-beta-D-manno-heptose-7-phosphate kinase [Armatimonadetes bacterium]|nr:D-glycero-beta-D-manno-heptose-7-phosphate kinase [Armatimonadota bacterium]
MTRERLLEILSRFHDSRILVVGDCMVDQWIWGKVNRISPEAPVPVVEVDFHTYTPGGASNVVSNLSSLGARASIFGIRGRDDPGKKLVAALRGKGIDVDGLLVDYRRPTTLKTRIIAHSQQVVRADYETRQPVSGRLLDKLLRKIGEALKSARGLLISDYGKGIVSPELLEELVRLARKTGVFVSGGPKPRNAHLFRNFSLIALNQSEASAASAVLIQDEDSLALAAEKLLKTLTPDSLVITRGEHGMSCYDPEGRVFHHPALASQVYDVSGAGDTVIAVLTLALACGATLQEGTHLANHAAGIVVKKLGTATVSANEMTTSINGQE